MQVNFFTGFFMFQGKKIVFSYKEQAWGTIDEDITN